MYFLIFICIYLLDIKNIFIRFVLQILLTISIQKFSLYDMQELYAERLHILPKELIIFEVVLSLFLYGYILWRSPQKEIKEYGKDIQELFIYIFPLIFLQRESGTKYFWLLGLLELIITIRKKEYRISKEKMTANILCILSFLIISFVYYTRKQSEYSHEYYFLYLQYTFLFISINKTYFVVKDWEEINKVLWISCILPISLAGVQLLGNHFTFGRMNNVYNISNYSFLVALGAIISLYLFLFQKEKKFLYLFPYFYFMVLFSGTRMIWLVTILMTLFLLISSLNWRVYLCCVLLVVTGWYTYQHTSEENLIKQRIISIVNFEETSSSAIRLFMWREAYEQFLQRPWFGNGYTSYMECSMIRHPIESINAEEEHYWDMVLAYNNSSLHHAHSNFFELLSGTGAFGIFSFYLYQFYITFILLRYRKWKKRICDIGLLVLLVYHLYSLTDVTLYMSKVSMILFISMAYIITSITHKKRGE